MDSALDSPLFSQIDDSFWKGTTNKDCNNPVRCRIYFEDFTSVGISLNKHPITLLEEANWLGWFTHMKDLNNNDTTMVTRCWSCDRQSPGTAAGVTLVTLEDNTGNINVVVWGATARAQQQAYSLRR